MASTLPGFGVTGEERARDEALGLYSAYLRDVKVQDCMAAAGYTWEVEMRYPEEDVDRVAQWLGLERLPSWDPRGINDAAEDRLSSADLDAYYVALYGVDAAGLVEAEHDDNLLRGCHAERETVTGFWDLRDDVERLTPPLREEYRSEPRSEEAARCAAGLGLPEVVGPAEADAALDRGVSPQVVAEVEAACGPTWEQDTAGMRAYVMDALAASSAPEVVALRKAAEDLEQEMRADREFLDLVARWTDGPGALPDVG